MFPYRCETFTTANVSVLNVSTAIVNTINASSITSDMTIGANLNGGSLTIGNSNANIILNGPATINGTITPGYSYPIYSTPNNIPNQIGARGIFGGGGNQLYVIGDGNWRSYAYYNNVPLGIYSVQVWMTPGGSSYTPTTVNSALYIRSTPFYQLPPIATTTPNNIVEQPTIIQYLYNPLLNFQKLSMGILLSGNNPEINQYVSHIIVHVDQPSIAMCLKATCTPQESFGYTEMVLTRIA